MYRFLKNSVLITLILIPALIIMVSDNCRGGGGIVLIVFPFMFAAFFVIFQIIDIIRISNGQQNYDFMLPLLLLIFVLVMFFYVRSLETVPEGTPSFQAERGGIVLSLYDDQEFYARAYFTESYCFCIGSWRISGDTLILQKENDKCTGVEIADIYYIDRKDSMLIPLDEYFGKLRIVDPRNND